MKRLVASQVMILFICALVCTTTLCSEGGQTSRELSLDQQHQMIKASLDTVKKQKEDPYVYITKSGKKYHESGCGYLKKSKIKIRLSEAKRRGYRACSRCQPPK